MWQGFLDIDVYRVYNQKRGGFWAGIYNPGFWVKTLRAAGFNVHFFLPILGGVLEEEYPYTNHHFKQLSLKTLYPRIVTNFLY